MSRFKIEYTTDIGVMAAVPWSDEATRRRFESVIRDVQEGLIQTWRERHPTATHPVIIYARVIDTEENSVVLEWRRS